VKLLATEKSKIRNIKSKNGKETALSITYDVIVIDSCFDAQDIHVKTTVIEIY